jgi:hypothetical protein
MVSTLNSGLVINRSVQTQLYRQRWISNLKVSFLDCGCAPNAVDLHIN